MYVLPDLLFLFCIFASLSSSSFIKSIKPSAIQRPPTHHSPSVMALCQSPPSSCLLNLSVVSPPHLLSGFPLLRMLSFEGQPVSQSFVPSVIYSSSHMSYSSLICSFIISVISFNLVYPLIHVGINAITNVK